MFPQNVQKIISSYQILGIIPLDKVLHFIVGMILTIVMRKMNFRFRWVFGILVMLEAVKEFIDSYAYSSTLEEHLLDALATLSYPTIILIVIYIKKKTSQVDGP